jgi:L-rhamnose mutarotase
MIRRAFTMRLKEGALAEYKAHHDSIATKWPDLVEEIERSGIATINTFQNGLDFFSTPRFMIPTPGSACGIRRSIAAGPN